MSGVSTQYVATADGLAIVNRSQDVEPLIEHLAALRNETTGKSASGELYHIGDIPKVVVEQYLKEAGVTFHDFCREGIHIKRILTNPDYSKFRVWGGQF